MRRIASSTAIAAWFAAALASAGPAASQNAASASVDRSLIPYASTRDSVRLPDGRTIHLVCMGQGTPSVILLAGVADWSIAWNKVQPAVAAKTRICAWDRAGLGLSDPPAKPQLIDATTADLEAALAAAHVQPPYVLVGHSVGGYESLLFADRHPSQVSGMVPRGSSIPGRSQNHGARHTRNDRVYGPYGQGASQSARRACEEVLRRLASRHPPQGWTRPGRLPAAAMAGKLPARVDRRSQGAVGQCGQGHDCFHF